MGGNENGFLARRWPGGRHFRDTLAETSHRVRNAQRAWIKLCPANFTTESTELLVPNSLSILGSNLEVPLSEGTID